MSRTAVFSALVLKNCPSGGSSNSEISLLTAEEGIIRATVFGGAKSKLRSHSAPYNSGQVWIYRNKAKEYAKLSDFDVHSWRPGLRELYDRSMAAAAVADTILSSHGGGGDWSIALSLAVSALDSLENANEELCNRLLVHFLWQWAHFLGIQPHLDCCAGCDDKINNEPLWFNTHENTTFCDRCAAVGSERNKLIKLNPGCRKWLSAAKQIEAAQLHRYSMDNKSFGEAKALCTAILTGAIGKRLTSWEW
jgi:DNA repair protein RecO (recombination protein O)